MKSVATSIIVHLSILILLLLVTPGTAAQIKVACIGNSITSGYQSIGVSYVPKLQELLGSGYEVQNDGVSGTTLLKKGDNSYWKNGKLPQVFAFNPDIITIKLGTNDTKPQNWGVYESEFKKDYEALIDTLSGVAVQPKIYLVLPVPVYYNASTVSWGIRDSIVNKMIPIIKQIGTERGLPVLDANTSLLGHPEHFSDAIHPNKNGADSIAQVIYRGIKNVTPVVFTAGSVSAGRGGSFQKVYRVFQQGDIEGVFFDMRGKNWYTAEIVSINGSLLSAMVIDGSPESRRSLQKCLRDNRSLKLVVVRQFGR